MRQAWGWFLTELGFRKGVDSSLKDAHLPAAREQISPAESQRAARIALAAVTPTRLLRNPRKDGHSPQEGSLVQGCSTLGKACSKSFLNLSQVCLMLWSLTDVIVYKTLACQPIKLQENIAK